jgi:hypothetical protein
VTVATLLAQSQSGFLRSRGTTYARAQTASDTVNVVPDGAACIAGQGLSGTNDIWENFVAFDLSAIPPAAVVQSALLGLYITADASTQDFVLEARADAYGATMELADWLTGTQIGSTDTLRASLSTAAGVALNVYTDMVDVAMTSLAQANVGTTLRLLLASDRTRQAIPAITAENVTFHGGTGANPARLVVTYVVPQPGLATALDSSATVALTDASGNVTVADASPGLAITEAAGNVALADAAAGADLGDA